MKSLFLKNTFHIRRNQIGRCLGWAEVLWHIEREKRLFHTLWEIDAFGKIWSSFQIFILATLLVSSDRVCDNFTCCSYTQGTKQAVGTGDPESPPWPSPRLAVSQSLAASLLWKPQPNSTFPAPSSNPRVNVPYSHTAGQSEAQREQVLPQVQVIPVVSSMPANAQSSKWPEMGTKNSPLGFWSQDKGVNDFWSHSRGELWAKRTHLERCFLILLSLLHEDLSSQRGTREVMALSHKSELHGKLLSGYHFQLQICVVLKRELWLKTISKKLHCVEFKKAEDIIFWAGVGV